MEAVNMKAFADSLHTKRLCGIVVLLLGITSLTACSSVLPAQGQPDQSTLAKQAEQLEKLKAAEYQDYMTAMTFEDSNQKLGNYYAAKGSQVHSLIDQMEKGQQVDSNNISRALDNSDSEKYDDRPPVPLDDETGNGY
jgi:hypothetical protein